MSKKHDSPPTVIGRPPKKHLRDDLDDLGTVVAKSDLDLHILRLLALHPAIKVRFRNHDLAALDDATKHVLLQDLNEVLGVPTLKKFKP